MVSMRGRTTAATRPSNRIPMSANKDGVGYTVKDKRRILITEAFPKTYHRQTLQIRLYTVCMVRTELPVYVTTLYVLVFSSSGAKNSLLGFYFIRNANLIDMPVLVCLCYLSASHLSPSSYIDQGLIDGFSAQI